VIPVARPSIGQEELTEVGKVFETGWLGMGALTKQFEDEIKKYIGVKNVIAVNTGTSALHIALDALALRNRDEVIVPSLTFVASVQAIVACGAIPVFCDVYSDTLNMDIEDVKRKITKKTKAIMPVHYSGLPCKMDELIEIAKNNKIRLVEDAAHAFGSLYKGKKIGSFGDITCFSFDPIKIVTCGEGGAVVTSDDTLAQMITKKRILGIDKDTWSRYKHERSWFYGVDTLGFRYHLSNINAAIGLVQLKKINEFIRRKKGIVRKYDEGLKEIPNVELIYHDYENTAPFNYIVKVKKKREELMEYLKKNGIDSGIHYIPNHLQPFFQKYTVKLPVTEELFEQILTLPLYYDLSDSEVDKIINCIKSFYK